MKKIIFLTIGIMGLLSLHAQQFDDYFINKTLRIDYQHIGNFNQESVEIKSFHAGGIWDGTFSQLTEPNRYGDVLFEAFDAESNRLIFSRSFSCLFNEYRTTERGRTEIGNFEECIKMPFPKKSIYFTFTGFDRRKQATQIYKGTFDPQKDVTVDFVKEYKVLNLHVNKNVEHALDILFIPDGYSKQDKKKMKTDMKRFAEYILNCAPYNENLEKVNIRAIEGYSEESGITDPNGKFFVNTLLNSSYNVLDLDRYLMCLNVWKMNDIADDAPYDVIIIIANSSKYGGGGIYNFYCTVNNEGQYSDYVIVHELGHLFGGLADEYYTSEVSVQDFYPPDIEPVEPNLTTLVDFDSKWKKMMDVSTPIPTFAEKKYENTLGVYEGGGYVAKGVYRPYIHCTMKDKLYNGFCPVCLKVLAETIDYYAK